MMASSSSSSFYCNKGIHYQLLNTMKCCFTMHKLSLIFSGHYKMRHTIHCQTCRIYG